MHKSNNKRSESKFNSKVLKQLRMIQSSSITKGLKFFGSAIGVQKFLLGTTVAAVAWAGCVSCHKSYVNSNFVKQPMLTCLTEEGDADIDKLKKTKKLKNKIAKKRHPSQKTSKSKGSKVGKKEPKLRLKRLEAQGLASEGKLKKARKKPHNPSRALNPIKRRACLPRAARTRSKSKACVQPSLERARFKKRKQKEELKKFKIENGKQLEKALHKLNLSNKKALMKLQQALTKKLKNKTVKKRHISQKTSKPKESKVGKKGPKLRLKRLEAQGLASEGKKLKKARKKPHNPSRALNPIKRRVCAPSKAARTRNKSKACVQPSLETVRLKKRKQKEELKKFKIENGKQLEKALHKLNLSNKKALMKLQQALTKKLKSKIVNKRHTSQKTSKPKGSKASKKEPKLRLKRLEAQGLASEVKELKKARKKPHNPSRALNPIKRRVCAPSKAARTRNKSKACVQPSLERVRFKKGKQKEELKKFKIENGKQLEKALHKLNLSNKKALMKLQQALTKNLKNKTVKKRHTSQKTSKPKGSKAGKKGPKLRLKRLEAQGLASEGKKLKKARKKPHNLSRALNPIKRRACVPRAARTRSKSKACVQPSLERVRFKKGKSVNPKLIQRWLKLLKLPFFAKLAEEYLNKNLEKKSNKNNISNTVEAEKVYEIAQNDSDLKDLKLEAKEVEQLKDAFKTNKSKKLKIKEFEYFFKKTDCDGEQLDCYCRQLGTFEEQKVAYGCSDKSNMVEFKNMLWIKLNKTVLGVSLEPNGGPGKGRILLDMGCMGSDFFKEEELAGNEIEAKEAAKEESEEEVAKEESEEKSKEKAKGVKEVKEEVEKAKEEEEAKRLELADDEIKQTESHPDKICSPSYLKAEHKKGELSIFSSDADDYAGDKSTCYDSHQEEESNDHNCNSKINNETNNNALICQENCKTPGKPKGQEELAGNEIESEEKAKVAKEAAKREAKEEEEAKREAKEKAKRLELADDEIKQTESHSDKICSPSCLKAEHKKGELSIFSSDADDYAGDKSTCYDSHQEEKSNDCNCNSKINNETNNNVLMCQENRKTPGKPKEQEELAGNEIESEEKAKEVKGEAKVVEEEVKEEVEVVKEEEGVKEAANSKESNDYNCNSKINNETNNNALICQENCKNPGKLKGQEEFAGNEIEAKKEKAKEEVKVVKEEVKEGAKRLELADDEIKQTESHSDKICSPSYLKAEHKKGKQYIFSSDADDYAGDKSTCYDSNQEEKSNDCNCNSKINNGTNNNAFICQENCKNPGKLKGQEELAGNEIESKEKVKEESEEKAKVAKEESEEEVVKEEVKEGVNSKEFNDHNCNSKIKNETNNNVLMCQENCKTPGKLKGHEELAENEIEVKEKAKREVKEEAKEKAEEEEAKILELDDDDIKKLLSYIEKILSMQYSKADQKNVELSIFSSAGDYSGDMPTCDESNQGEEFNNHNYNSKINNETNNNELMCQENLRLFRV